VWKQSVKSGAGRYSFVGILCDAFNPFATGACTVKSPRILIRAISILMAVLALSAVAFATSFSSIVVYGDSLSDNGNLYTAYPWFQPFQPTPPYYAGRRSNGPVAVEYLAQRTGAPLVDYAWVGATTGKGNFVDGGTPDAVGFSGMPGMRTAYDWTSGVPVDPSALYVVWGGPNDFFELTNPADASMFIDRAVTDLLFLVNDLESRGAEHILVPNMPDLGKTPEGLADPATSFFLTQVTQGFNSALLPAVQHAGAQYFDTFSLFTDMVNDPAKYGFTNVTSQCFDGATVCADPDQYLFWDNVHPTTAAHSVVGSAMANAVPEPCTLLLFGTGLCGIALGVWRRRR
jgi:phospholipase/lecithinase/hemolysin